MLPVVEIPAMVRPYAPFFASVFSPEAFTQFQREISGLMVSENTTVEGINRIFVLDVRNQRSLNRLLTESPCSVDALNQARIEVLASIPGPQRKPRGVLSLDDTLLTHYGKSFEKIAYLYDSAQACYVWAHHLVNLHYRDDPTDSPLSCILWKPAEIDALETGLLSAGVPIRHSKYVLKRCDPKKWRNDLLGLWRRHQHEPAVPRIYQSQLFLGQPLLTQFFSAPPARHLPVTFDHWYTQPACCRFLHQTREVPSVGTLAGDAGVLFKTGAKCLAEFARQLQDEHYQAVKAGEPPVFGQITIPYKGAKATYDSYCKTHHLQNFGTQRLVINHREADLSDTAGFYISHRWHWQATGMTRIRRHRWPVDVSHEEGNAEDLEQSQVRDFEAISRHIALVAVTYRLLRAAHHDRARFHQLQQTLETRLEGSGGSWRRNTQAHVLWALATFIATGLAQGQTLHDVMAPLIAAVAYEG